MDDKPRVTIFDKKYLMKFNERVGSTKFIIVLKKKSIDDVCLPFVSQSGLKNKLSKGE